MMLNLAYMLSDQISSFANADLSINGKIINKKVIIRLNYICEYLMVWKKRSSVPADF